MFMIFDKGEKPLPKMMSIFLGHLWIFELNHIVFELEHLMPINILNASILLETIGGCWK